MGKIFQDYDNAIPQNQVSCGNCQEYWDGKCEAVGEKCKSFSPSKPWQVEKAVKKLTWICISNTILLLFCLFLAFLIVK